MCGVTKVKSVGIMKLCIDINAMFEWLKSNEYTNYDNLPSCQIQDDYDDEL